MAGYAARTGHSNGTLDPLTVSALALSVQGRELVIVSADVVAVDAVVTQKVAAGAGIARSSCCSPPRIPTAVPRASATGCIPPALNR